MAKRMSKVLISLIVTSSLCYPQVFGKNKVRYKGFCWHIIETEHFEIYFTPEIEELAVKCSVWAESAYRKLSSHLKMDVERKIPFILFASHYDFQQTNIILEMIETGVGGFAEVFKFRIVIPFTGSYSNLKRTITHELTHIFCYQLLYGSLLESIFSNQMVTPPPLWFIEGLAEYEAGEMSPEAEMVLRDAVIEGGLIPIDELVNFSKVGNLYLAYCQSHSFVKYISERYGEEKLSLMLRKFAGRVSLERVIKSSLDTNLQDLERAWIRELKRRYWPLIAERGSPEDFRMVLGACSFPRFSPGGDVISAIYRDYDQSRLILIRAEDGKVIKEITEGIRFQRFEELKRTAPSWSTDGTRIAFLVKKEREDAVLIFSLLRDRIIREVSLSEIDEATHISFSDEKERMVVAGYKDGKGGLWILEIPSGSLSRITDGLDTHPSWKGNKILFLREEESGSSSICIYDLKAKTVQTIISLKDTIAPIWIRNGEIAFILNDGSFNLYVADPKERRYAKVTDIISGISSCDWHPQRERVALSIYHRRRHNLYIMDVDRDRLSWKRIEKPKAFERKIESIVQKPKKKRYSPRLTPDWRKGDFLYDSRQGLSCNINIAASDILGNHRFILVTDYASGLPNFSNLTLFYQYLAKRPSFGIGIFKEKRRYFERESEFIDAEYGLIGYIDYPFSKFTRAEFATLFESWDREYVEPADKEDEAKNITLLSIAFVRDTSSWSWMGPVSGLRAKISYDVAVNIFGDPDSLRFFTKKADFRKYFRLSRNTVLATRFFYKESCGRDKREFSLGGVSLLPTRWEPLLRGFDYDQFWGNGVASANAELRIPFIDRIDFALGFSAKSIRALIFFDTGAYWKAEDTSYNRLSSFGIGIRMVLGFLPFRLDYAWPSRGDPKMHFSLGYDF
jgi:hypothetical protein